MLVRSSRVLIVLTLAVGAPIPAQAQPQDVTVVVYEPDCAGMKCRRTFRLALVDRIASALTRSRRFKPVDRTNLSKVLGEQVACKKGIKRGLVSKECRIEVGRVMLARKMVLTRLVKLGRRSYQVTVSLTDLSTMKTERSQSESCMKCSQLSLLALAARAVEGLARGGTAGGGGAPGSGAEPAAPPVPEGKTAPEQALPPVGSELGHLRIEGSPRGARVDVTGPRGFSGPKAGALPRTWRSVPAGAYKIKVRAANHDPQQTQAQVLPDRTKVVTVELVKSHGRLTIGGKPAGARMEVACAGGYRKVFGLTRGFTLRRVPRGTCTVKVSRTGYTSFSQQVEVVGGQEARVSVVLKQQEVASPGGGQRSGKAGLVWVSIPGGSFKMGSTAGDSDEMPLHWVTVKSFSMGKTEVTVGQYNVCERAGACRAPEWAERGSKYNLNSGFDKHYRGFTSGTQPVVGVAWQDARRFCRWAGGRLPSESEWEYAARSGGKGWKYPWGDAAATCSRAVMNDGGLGCGKKRTWPVCSKTAGNTVQGLCDMSGNVWEWVEDCWHGDYKGAPSTGSAWTSNCSVAPRVVRGGCWRNTAGNLRAANRGRNAPGYLRAFYRRRFAPGSRDYFLGFRCAR